jgi:DnaJ-class molecular chaperone
MLDMAKKIIAAVKKVVKKAVKAGVKKAVKEVKKEVHKATAPKFVRCDVCSGSGLLDPHHLCACCHGNGEVAK